MQFIALTVIIISLIAIAYRDLRMALISLAGILLAAIVFYFLSTDDLELAGGEALKASVSLHEPQISRGYADGFVLNVRVENNHHSQTLQNFVIRSTLSDCETGMTNCLVIGEESSVVKLRIPPGQARDAQINLRIKQLNPLRGEAVWQHQVEGVR